MMWEPRRNSLKRTEDVDKKQKKNQPQRRLFLREVTMVAEVHCILSHFSATSQKKGVLSSPSYFLQTGSQVAGMAQNVAKAAGTSVSSL